MTDTNLKALQALMTKYDLSSDTILKLASYVSAGHSIVLDGISTSNTCHEGKLVARTERLFVTTLDPDTRTFTTHYLEIATKATPLVN